MQYPICLIFLLGMGCGQPDTSSLHTVLPDSLMERYETPVVSNAVGIPEGSGWTEAALRDSYHTQLAAQFYDAWYFGGDTWLERADAVGRFRDSLIVGDSQVPAFWAEQLVALNVIGPAAMSTEMATDSLWRAPELEVLGSNVDVLIRHHNPQAIVIASALERLSGHWSDERIAEAARLAIQFASEEEIGPLKGTFDRVTQRGVERLQVLAEMR